MYDPPRFTKDVESQDSILMAKRKYIRKGEMRGTLNHEQCTVSLEEVGMGRLGAPRPKPLLGEAAAVL